MPRLARPLPLAVLLVVALVALAWSRGLDHDESQYVAAARLVAQGLLPYRDFAYLQTPLQPFVFAPVAWLFGGWTWPALRIANALLGAIVVFASWRAMREAGADEPTATACATLLAACDILLFSAGTARNDALPAAMLACALVPMLRAERGEDTRRGALLVGLLLAGAAAAKISYALPAAAYGVYALAARRHRPLWVALGALPPAAFVAWSAWLAPDGFVFGTLTFPAQAPADYYLATGRDWKLAWWAKAVDALKFLALGPALPALVAVAWRRGRARPGLLEWLVIAGLAAALLPAPTWRQYLLPALPPLFVLLALRRPRARGWRIGFALFAAAGLAPSMAAVSGRPGMTAALLETEALASVSGLSGVATLAPQFLPRFARADPRFATGPFYFRSRGLLAADAERRLVLVSRARLAAAFAARPPAAVIVGGEGVWTSGDPSLDGDLERWALTRGWRREPLPASRLRVYRP